MVLVVQNEAESLLLRQSTDGRRRMQDTQQLAHTRTIVQRETEVTSQMCQMTGSRRIRPVLRKVGRKQFQLSRDIGRHIALFLQVLVTPGYMVLPGNSPSQRHRLPLIAFTREQRLRCGCQPQSALGSVDQRDEHAGIAVTRSAEQFHRRCPLHAGDVHAARKHQLLEVTIQQMRVEIAKVYMIVCSSVRRTEIANGLQRQIRKHPTRLVGLDQQDGLLVGNGERSHHKPLLPTERRQ